MKTKWYISTLIVILTLLGAVSQQSTSLPNQEIVLKFVNDEISSDDAQHAIAYVEQQLQRIGVANIQVLEQEDGQLKITYYSPLNAASIKEILSEEKELEFGYASNSQDKNTNETPTENTLGSYNLDVYEIHDANDTTSSLGGKYAITLKAENDRFFNPNISAPTDEIVIRQDNSVVKVAYKLNRSIAVAIDDISHIIPEVRAGPSSSMC